MQFFVMCLKCVIMIKSAPLQCLQPAPLSRLPHVWLPKSHVSKSCSSPAPWSAAFVSTQPIYAFPALKRSATFFQLTTFQMAFT